MEPKTTLCGDPNKIRRERQTCSSVILFSDLGRTINDERNRSYEKERLQYIIYPK